jgi:hypothetical protein
MVKAPLISTVPFVYVTLPIRPVLLNLSFFESFFAESNPHMDINAFNNLHMGHKFAFNLPPFETKPCLKPKLPVRLNFPEKWGLMRILNILSSKTMPFVPMICSTNSIYALTFTLITKPTTLKEG